MMAFGGLQPNAPGDSAVDKLKKEKEKGSSESAPTPKTKTYVSKDSDNIINVSGEDKGNEMDLEQPKTNSISASEEFRRANPGESKAEYQEAYNNWLTSKNSSLERKDLHNMSAMMRKVKNPLKK